MTIEEHRPMVFLNLDPVNMNTENDTAGLKAVLNEENKNDMFRLPLLHHASDEVREYFDFEQSISAFFCRFEQLHNGIHRFMKLRKCI